MKLFIVVLILHEGMLRKPYNLSLRATACQLVHEQTYRNLRLSNVKNSG